MERNMSGFYFFILFIFKVLWIEDIEKERSFVENYRVWVQTSDHSLTAVDLRKYVRLQTSFSHFSLK